MPFWRQQNDGEANAGPRSSRDGDSPRWRLGTTHGKVARARLAAVELLAFNLFVLASLSAYQRVAGDFSLRIDFCRAVNVSMQLAVASRFWPKDKVSERTLLLRRESSRICVWIF